LRGVGPDGFIRKSKNERKKEKEKEKDKKQNPIIIDEFAFHMARCYEQSPSFFELSHCEKILKLSARKY
jgi:hypothetical protein